MLSAERRTPSYIVIQFAVYEHSITEYRLIFATVQSHETQSLQTETEFAKLEIAKPEIKLVWHT